jgi:hypothetical protein
MSIIYFVIVSILLGQWMYWLMSQYPEIRRGLCKIQPYLSGTLILFVLILAISFGVARIVALIPVPHVTTSTFTTTFFIGIIGIFCFRVFLSNNRQAFRKSCVSGTLFALALIGIQLFSSFLLL